MLANRLQQIRINDDDGRRPAQAMAQKVVLDDYNSDLNLVIEDNGYGASTLNHPRGFRLIWAGARATHGVYNGRVYFEVKIESYQDSQCENAHIEEHSHLVRVGWSSTNSSLDLGEDVMSFGYGGAGLFSSKGRFTPYGQRFGRGDVIGTLLDLESKPAKISFMKNGFNLGTAVSLRHFSTGQSKNALFPHVYAKNCRIKVNFGQNGVWFPPPRGFKYMEQVEATDRVRGATAPTRRADCEVLMAVGLPGSGKTTWATMKQKICPEKCYNIIGTDVFLDKMRVAGLNKNYTRRWNLLIEMATECFNTILRIAASKNRNYILDQTNVYASARRRKMAAFSGFRRIAIVIQPNDAELIRRTQKQQKENQKDIPFVEIRKMKANFSLPEISSKLFDNVEYPELPASAAAALVGRYNRENAQYKDA